MPQHQLKSLLGGLCLLSLAFSSNLRGSDFGIYHDKWDADYSCPAQPLNSPYYIGSAGAIDFFKNYDLNTDKERLERFNPQNGQFETLATFEPGTLGVDRPFVIQQGSKVLFVGNSVLALELNTLEVKTLIDKDSDNVDNNSYFTKPIAHNNSIILVNSISGSTQDKSRIWQYQVDTERLSLLGQYSNALSSNESDADITIKPSVTVVDDILLIDEHDRRFLQFDLLTNNFNSSNKVHTLLQERSAVEDGPNARNRMYILGSDEAYTYLEYVPYERGEGRVTELWRYNPTTEHLEKIHDLNRRAKCNSPADGVLDCYIPTQLKINETSVFFSAYIAYTGEQLMAFDKASGTVSQLSNIDHRDQSIGRLNDFLLTQEKLILKTQGMGLASDYTLGNSTVMQYDLHKGTFSLVNPYTLYGSNHPPYPFEHNGNLYTLAKERLYQFNQDLTEVTQIADFSNRDWLLRTANGIYQGAITRDPRFNPTYVGSETWDKWGTFRFTNLDTQQTREFKWGDVYASDLIGNFTEHNAKMFSTRWLSGVSTLHVFDGLTQENKPVEFTNSPYVFSAVEETVEYADVLVLGAWSEQSIIKNAPGLYAYNDVTQKLKRLGLMDITSAHSFVVLDDILYFFAESESLGKGLYSYSHHADSIRQIVDLHPGKPIPDAIYLYPMNDRLVFQSRDEYGAWQIWMYAPLSDAIIKLNTTDISGYMLKDQLYQHGEQLYLTIDDGIHGYEPWIYKASDNSLEMLLDFNPGPKGSFYAKPSNPHSHANFVELNGSLYFFASVEDASGSNENVMEHYKLASLSLETNELTYVTQDIYSMSEEKSASQFKPIVFDDRLFFITLPDKLSPGSDDYLQLIRVFDPSTGMVSPVRYATHRLVKSKLPFPDNLLIINDSLQVFSGYTATAVYAPKHEEAEDGSSYKQAFMFLSPDPRDTNAAALTKLFWLNGELYATSEYPYRSWGKPCNEVSTARIGYTAISSSNTKVTRAVEAGTLVTHEIELITGLNAPLTYRWRVFSETLQLEGSGPSLSYTAPTPTSEEDGVTSVSSIFSVFMGGTLLDEIVFTANSYAYLDNGKIPFELSTSAPQVVTGQEIKIQIENLPYNSATILWFEKRDGQSFFIKEGGRELTLTAGQTDTQMTREIVVKVIVRDITTYKTISFVTVPKPTVNDTDSKKQSGGSIHSLMLLFLVLLTSRHLQRTVTNRYGCAGYRGET